MGEKTDLVGKELARFLIHTVIQHALGVPKGV